MLSTNLFNQIGAQLQSPFTGEALFDQLSDIVFFIKNARCEYAVVNHTLVERCGLQDKSQIVGRTASQVFRPPLGESYEMQDRRVLKSARPLLMQLELHVYPGRDVGWCLTSKLPLLRPDGQAAGLVGVSQDLRVPDSNSDDYRQLAVVVDYAKANIAVPPSVPELAELAGMSRYQLDRRMVQVFGLTTGQWLVKLRIDFAERLLSETDAPIATIAVDAGYADQSAFTRQFRQATGLSPRKYRQARRSSSKGDRIDF